MRASVFVAVGVLCATGCRQLFQFEEVVIRVDSQDPDSQVPDALVCTEAVVECASVDVLRTCSAPGVPAVDTACSWGCLMTTGVAHCAQIIPAGGGAMTADLDPTGLIDVDLNGTLADDGSISGTFARPAGVGIINGVDFVLRNNVAVFSFKSLRINGPLSVRGTSAIALVADGTIVIGNVIDARGTCGAGAGRTAGPGGFAGGLGSSTAAGFGAGEGSSAQDAGGGGGGHGGEGGIGQGLQDGGVTFGDATIAMLVGGGGGGGGRNALGGGGGGALQLVSNTSIDVMGGANGINAGGCGGSKGTGGGSDGGGGGGAGGTVLLEAPTMTIAGSIAVNGGGGGGGGGAAVGIDGSGGTIDRVPAAGGGNGGVGGAGPVSGGTAGAATGGGGGGGIGRIRVNTRTGTATVMVGASLSPGFNDAATTATQGIAVTQ